MNQIISYPGFQHVTENILLNLNYQDVMNCRLVCKSFEKVLKNPIFWLRKCSKRGFSKNNYADWLRAIQISKNTKAEKNILVYLNLLVKRGTIIDVPCLINEETIKNYLVLIEKKPEKFTIH